MSSTHELFHLTPSSHLTCSTVCYKTACYHYYYTGERLHNISQSTLHCNLFLLTAAVYNWVIYRLGTGSTMDALLCACEWKHTQEGMDIQLPTTVQWYDIDSLTTLLLSCLGKTNWANHLFFHLHYVIIFVGYFDDISLSYSCSHCVMCINERSQIALSLEFNISCKYMRPLSFCVGIFTALKLFKFNTKIKKSKQACCKVFALLLFIYLFIYFTGVTALLTVSCINIAIPVMSAKLVESNRYCQSMLKIQLLISICVFCWSWFSKHTESL